MAETIICPSCGNEIALSDALSKQIEEKYEKSYKAAIKRKDDEYKAKAAELESAKESMAEQVANQVKQAKAKIEQDVKRKYESEIGLELKDLKQQIDEKSKKLDESQVKELEFRKKQREYEEKTKSLELEITRRTDEARLKITEEVAKKAVEDNRLKLAEKDKQLEGMHKQIEELKRKSEQGSQQIQGEVVEVELEKALKNTFPIDEILPVEKGISGADIIQLVRNSLGQACGTIIWETKQAKDWSDKWLGKLREDQRAKRAEVAVLMTRVLPDGITRFSQMEGIWVTNYDCALNLAQAIRLNLIELNNTKAAVVGKGEKMEAVYSYLISTQFRHRVEAIVEAFTTMKMDLDQEKRAYSRIWSKREKQIESVILNTSGLYGDLQGIVGSTLPRIESLEMEALPAGDGLASTAKSSDS
jgi:hypothetical protein